MSRDSVVRTLGPEELEEWLLGLSVLPPSQGGEGDGTIRERLRDGVALCQLMNKLKPGSVDEVRYSHIHRKQLVEFLPPSLQIKPKRSSGDAEENILRFLQACTTLGIKKVSLKA